MPKGVRGSGPYSKYEADGVTLKKGTARKRTATKRTTRKTTAKATTPARRGRPPKAVSNGNGSRPGGVIDASVMMDSGEAVLTLIKDNGNEEVIRLARPSVVLDLTDSLRKAERAYFASR